MVLSRANFVNINPVSVANSIRMLPRPKDPAWHLSSAVSQRGEIVSALKGSKLENGASLDQMVRIGVHAVSAPTTDPEAEFSKLALIFAETDEGKAPLLLDCLDRREGIGPVPESVMQSFSIGILSPHLAMWSAIFGHDLNNLMMTISGWSSQELNQENPAEKKYFDLINSCNAGIKEVLSGKSTIGAFISAMELLSSDMSRAFDDISYLLSPPVFQRIEPKIRELPKFCSLYRQYTPEEMMIRYLQEKMIGCSEGSVAEEFGKTVQFMFANREKPGELFRSVIRRAGIRRAMYGGPALDRDWQSLFSAIKPMAGGRQLLADTYRELEGTDNSMRDIIQSVLSQ